MDEISKALLGWYGRPSTPGSRKAPAAPTRLERFIPGILRDIDLRRDGADRYRILKRAPDWWSECAPSEADLKTAQRACEADLMRVA